MKIRVVVVPEYTLYGLNTKLRTKLIDVILDKLLPLALNYIPANPINLIENPQDKINIISFIYRPLIRRVCDLTKFFKRYAKRTFLCDNCLLYTSPSPRDLSTSRMPSSA